MLSLQKTKIITPGKECVQNDKKDGSDVEKTQVCEFYFEENYLPLPNLLLVYFIYIIN